MISKIKRYISFGRVSRSVRVKYYIVLRTIHRENINTWLFERAITSVSYFILKLVINSDRWNQNVDNSVD